MFLVKYKSCFTAQFKPSHFQIADDGTVVTMTDLSHVVPLKKQQGFLNMVWLIFSRLGNLASAFHPMILNVILSLLASCRYALDHREQVSYML